MGKVISMGRFPKQKPLTTLMVDTLRAAFKKQENNEPFGQADLDGSFAALVERELISSKTIVRNGCKEPGWFVTQSGIAQIDKLDCKTIAG